MGKLLITEVDAWAVEDLLAELIATRGGPRRANRSEALRLRARDIAVDLLADLGGISGLGRMTPAELESYLRSRAGEELAPRACARAILSAFELGKRTVSDRAAPVAITNSADVSSWGAPRLGALDHEELWLLALDGRSRLRAVRCVARGGLHGIGVRVADPIRLALRAAASAFVLVHNHPSGDPTPSKEDLVFTRRVAAASAVVGMPLLDHVVVARGGFSSVPFPSEASPADLLRSAGVGGVEA